MVREPFRADHSVHHNSPETLMQTENNDKPSMVMNLAVVLLALCAIGCRETHSLFSDRWQSSPPQTTPASAGTLHGSPGNISKGSSVFLSRKSRDNIGLTVVPLVLTTAWKVVELPAVMVDRPGVSDRGVTAPIDGTIVFIHAFPGTTVAPHAPLFTIRLVSDQVHKSQLELFQATREIDIANRQYRRLSELASSGALAQSRIYEIENQLDRLQATVEAYSQDLVARGLSRENIDSAARGEFVTELTVLAPPDITQSESEPMDSSQSFSFEVHSLDVELGQHVEAGKVLMHLADHRSLFIEGRGFKDDMPLVQMAASSNIGVEIDVDEPDLATWPAFQEKLFIDHISNTIDSASRTFAFFLRLENQWSTYEHMGETRLLWRFRPGNRLRLRIATEKMENVFVLPRQAVVHEGPQAFVFRQDLAVFQRCEVRVLYEDRLSLVLANNGSLHVGDRIVLTGAAALDRIARSQQDSSLPSNVHVHSDGTLHDPRANP